MTVAERYARAIQKLLPPSKIWQIDLAGVLSEVFLAAGDELARVDQRALDLIEEADPRTTDELLPDFERVLGLPGTGTTDARKAQVIALLLLRQRFRPADFQEVLAPILGLSNGDVEVIERTHAQAVAMGDEREIYRFFVYRDPGLGGAYDLVTAQAMLDRMKPSHTVGHVIESTSFLCDDPFSLCDRDILGA